MVTGGTMVCGTGIVILGSLSGTGFYCLARLVAVVIGDVVLVYPSLLIRSFTLLVDGSISNLGDFTFKGGSVKSVLFYYSFYYFM